MKWLIVVLSLFSCAAVEVRPDPYEELQSCPSPMTREQHASGAVRCRATCSSYGRNFDRYDAQCRCVCAPQAALKGW